MRRAAGRVAVVAAAGPGRAGPGRDGLGRTRAVTRAAGRPMDVTGIHMRFDTTAATTSEDVNVWTARSRTQIRRGLYGDPRIPRTPEHFGVESTTQETAATTEPNQILSVSAQAPSDSPSCRGPAQNVASLRLRESWVRFTSFVRPSGNSWSGLLLKFASWRF